VAISIVWPFRMIKSEVIADILFAIQEPKA
jgi:hypothetical protein